MTDTQAQIKELTLQNDLLKQLGTTAGFYEYYFKNIKHHRTNVECFNAVNDLYFDLFGEYRFSSFNAFRQSGFYTGKK
jgi:hypothetical protein